MDPPPDEEPPLPPGGPSTTLRKPYKLSCRMKLVKLVVLNSSGEEEVDDEDGDTEEPPAEVGPAPSPPGPPPTATAIPLPPAPRSSASNKGWSMRSPSPRASQRMERKRGLLTRRHSLAGKLLGLMGAAESSGSSIEVARSAGSRQAFEAASRSFAFSACLPPSVQRTVEGPRGRPIGFFPTDAAVNHRRRRGRAG